VVNDISEKAELVKYIEERIESILKEIDVKDAVILDLRLKNEQLARALVESITLNSVPLPGGSPYVGVS
jgi:hypothetical protein